MSMTSKVNPTLRANILRYLAIFSQSTNSRIHTSYLVNPTLAISLRTVQEATQKLANEGLIVRNGSFYSLRASNAANTNTVATAATV
jgi:Mn-dependent DtxR family transcriptional regulator